jgi:signal transduction histidine kinase
MNTLSISQNERDDVFICFLFLVMVKKNKKNKKNKIIMISAKPSDNPGSHNGKVSEEQFINSGALYCNVIENAGGVPFQLIFGPQPGEGYYLNVGPGIRQLLGIPSGEFTEKVFIDMIEEIVPLHDDMSSELSKSREKLVRGEIDRYKAEVLIRMPGGEKKWIQDTSLPLVEEETGKVIGAFGILFDIDERKQTLLNLENAREKAKESDRLKSAFLHNLSHEIRTPLNAIVGFSTLLSETENGSDEQQEYRDIITGSTDHLLEIINDIVEISNIEAANVTIRKEEVSLNTLIRNIYDRFSRTAAEKNISLSYVMSPDGDKVSLFTDEHKLSQILSNLIGNAMKFTKEGGVEYGYVVREGRVEFFVSDTGIGIPAEHHDKVFDRFYQAESGSTRNFPGTGLGLTISKAYVELMGGKIWFVSEPRKGSIFYFSLPR